MGKDSKLDLKVGDTDREAILITSITALNYF